MGDHLLVTVLERTRDARLPAAMILILVVAVSLSAVVGAEPRPSEAAGTEPRLASAEGSADQTVLGSWSRSTGVGVLLGAPPVDPGAFAAAPLSGSLAAVAAQLTPGPRIYVANNGGNTVSVIDPNATSTPITVTVGSGPYDVASLPDGSRVFVSNFNASNVSVINSATNPPVVVGTPIGVSGNPRNIAVSSTTGRAYVAIAQGSVAVIDTAAAAAVTTIPLNGPSGSWGIAMSQARNKVYVANRNTHDVSVIDGATNLKIKDIGNLVPGNPTPGPRFAAAAPDGNRVYVALREAGRVVAIDTATDTVTATYDVGGTPFGIAVTPDGSKVWTTNGTNTLAVIPLAAGTPQTKTLTQLSNPMGIAFTADGKAYVANQGNGTVLVIDVATETVIGIPIPVGSGPVGIAYRPAITPSVAVTVGATPVPAGASVTVSWSGIGAPNTRDWLGLFAAGETRDRVPETWVYLGASGACPTQVPTSALAQGQCSLEIPASLPAGTYDVRLFAQDSLTRLARSAAFSVRRASLTAAATGPISGGTVMTVTWSHIGNPTAKDWIGLFQKTASDRDEAHFLLACAGGTVCGVAEGTRSFELPRGLPPGPYEFRLFADDGYTRLAETPEFNVVGPSLSLQTLGEPPPAGTMLTVGAGASIGANWFGIDSPTTTDWIGVYQLGAGDQAYRGARRYLDGERDGSTDILLDANLPPGTYELRLFSADSFTRLATSQQFTVGGVLLRARPPSLAASGQLSFDWGIVDTPAASDWVGVFEPGESDATPESGPRTFLSCTTRPISARSAGSCTLYLSLYTLAAGTAYQLRLFSGLNGVRLAASDTFTIAGPVFPDTPTPAPTPAATSPPGAMTATAVASVTPGTPVLPPVSGTPRAYVTNYGSSNLSVLPAPTGSPAESSESIARGPVGIALHRKGTDLHLYVANSVDSTVSVFDVNSRQLVATIPVGNVPVGIAATPADGDGEVYVTNSANGLGNTVSVIQTSSNAVSGTLVVGRGPLGVTIAADGRAYVANNADNTVSEISGGVPTRTIPVGREPSAVRADPTRTTLYVANTGANSVSVVNRTSGLVDRTIAVGSAPTDLAVNADGTRLYVVNAGSNDVWVIDPGAASPTPTSISVGQQPAAATLSGDGTRLFVVNSLSNTVSVIDTSTFNVVETVAVGALPQAVVAR